MSVFSDSDLFDAKVLFERIRDTANPIYGGNQLLEVKPDIVIGESLCGAINAYDDPCVKASGHDGMCCAADGTNWIRVVIE